MLRAGLGYLHVCVIVFAETVFLSITPFLMKTIIAKLTVHKVKLVLLNSAGCSHQSRSSDCSQLSRLLCWDPCGDSLGPESQARTCLQTSPQCL